MGTIGSQIGRNFEQKRNTKWVKKKENLVKAYFQYDSQNSSRDLSHTAIRIGIHVDQ